MVRAVLKKGKIQPLDSLPESWEEGQKLIIEEVEPAPDLQDLEVWSREQAEGEMEKEAWVVAELAAWRDIYSGLSEKEIEEVEAIALDRSRFFRKEPE